MQSTLLAILLVVAAGVAWVVADGWVRIAYLVGAALAAIAAIVELHARGGAMQADEPDTPPGGFIIQEQTMLWLPASRHA